MSRDVTTALNTGLTAPVIAPFFAIDFEFTTSPLYFWSGIGTRTINGKTYTGSGTLLQLGNVSEVSDMSAQGCTLTCSGIPSQMLSLALTEPYQGRYCRIYLGVTNDLSTYTEIFTGLMDKMDIQEGQDSSTIVISVESRLIDLERPRARRFTQSDQQSRFPSDKGLDFIATLADAQLTWGKK
jgi:hypothetical protein